MAEGTHEAEKLRVFISYSRDDLAFADPLDVTLGHAGFDPKIDRHGIHGAENWEEQLGTLIREADTVVFVLSPSSAQSKVCAWEVEQAVKLGKRIIPVVCRPLGTVAAPPALAALNYIYFYNEPKSPGTSYRTGMTELVSALKTDLAWLREHTRYLQRAIEWDAGGRAPNRLLSGQDVNEAKAWLARQPKEAPAPTVLHLDFIKASEAWEREQEDVRQRQLEERERLVRQAEADRTAREAAQREVLAASRRVLRRTVAGLAAALLLAGAAGWFGWRSSISEKEARAAEQVARAAEEEARRQEAEAKQARDKFREMIERIADDQASRSPQLKAVLARVPRDILDTIVSFEIGSNKVYERRYEAPIWTGGPWGVNIGIGYDLGHHTREQFLRDWQPYFVAADLERLGAVVGLNGPAAKAAAAGLKDIFVPYKAAVTVFGVSTVTELLTKLDRAMPGAEKLPPECTGALVSVGYNRGFAMTGDRWREMARIRDHVASGEFERIPLELRAMKRLWQGSNLAGLVKRRELEAAWCETALAKTRVQPPPTSGPEAELTKPEAPR